MTTEIPHNNRASLSFETSVFVPLQNYFSTVGYCAQHVKRHRKGRKGVPFVIITSLLVSPNFALADETRSTRTKTVQKAHGVQIWRPRLDVCLFMKKLLAGGVFLFYFFFSRCPFSAQQLEVEGIRMKESASLSLSLSFSHSLSFAC